MIMFSAIKIFMSSIWVYLKPLVLQFMNKTGQLALNIAIDVVKDLSAEDLTSSEKREVAFGKIKGKLKDQGIEARDSIINSAIEIAVQNIKSLK